MKNKMIILSVIVFFCLLMTVSVFGSEVDTRVGVYIDAFSIPNVDSDMQKISGDVSALSGFSLKETAEGFISGEMPINPLNILKSALKLALGETVFMANTIKQLVIIAVLSAVLSSLSSSFCSKGVSDLGFYVCYIVLTVTLMQSFFCAAKLAGDTVFKITEAMKIMLPVFMTLMGAAGKIAEMSVTVPVISFIAQALSGITSRFLLPFVMVTASLEFVNYISERSILKEFSSLMKSISSWGVKGCAAIFMFVLSILRFGTPSVLRIVGKTAKGAVEAVPVVGSLMSSAVDTAAMLSKAVNNSVGCAAILFVVILCLVPLLRLLAMIVIYKLTAAVIEPVCEPRLVKCISAAGDYTSILFGAVFAAEVMFIFSVIVMAAS